MRRILAQALFGLVLAGWFPLVGAQPDLRAEPAPEVPPVYRDFWAQCNGAGHSFIIERDATHFGSGATGSTTTTSSEEDHWPVIHSYVRGLDGSNGARRWSYDALLWNVLLPAEVWAPVRGGDNWAIMNAKPYYGSGPVPPDNVQVIEDVNGDGVCDVAAYGWNLTTVGREVVGTGRLVVLDGAKGIPVWQIPIDYHAAYAGCPWPDVSFLGVPTGMFAYASKAGPRIAWKLSAGSYIRSCNGATLNDRVILLDARDGHELWERTFQDGGSGTYGGIVNTYFAGVADVDGSGDPAVIIDVAPSPFCVNPGGLQALADNLPLPDMVKDLVNGLLKPNYPWPSARALGGKNGTLLWGPVQAYTPPQGGLSLGEESLECVLGSNAKVVGDINEDGRSDVVVTYLVAEYQDPTTANGRYRTHVVPISGANGKLLWPGQAIKLQGWGHVTDLNPPGGPTHPYLAVGLVDVPSKPEPGARFPPKDARVTVLRSKDGSPLWGNVVQPLALDSRLAYDAALSQFQTALAPQDYDGDGVRDLFMPAKYDGPTLDEQGLLSVATHSYNLISGRTGRLLETLSAFGPLGKIVVCAGEAPNRIAVLSGHARRYDMTTFDVSKNQEVWRHALHIDRRPTAQLASVDLQFVGGRCAEADADRTLVGFDLGLFSNKRGEEDRGLHGFVDGNGTIEWLHPELYFNAPNVASLAIFGAPPPKPPVWVVASVPAGAISFGVVSGIGIVALATRPKRTLASSVTSIASEVGGSKD